MRNAFLMIGILLSLAISTVHSASLDELVGAQQAKALREASVKKMQVRSAKTALTPKSDGGERTAAEVERFDPSVVVEALYLYKKPAAAQGKAWTDAERTLIFNVLRSLSTLSGIEYFSASRGRMRVFYESSYVVEGPEASAALPDPVVDSVPGRSTLYAVQRDLSFGENRYRYDYAAGDADISFVQMNLTTMSYGFVPVLGKERLKTIVLLSDTDEGYLLYAVSAARAALVPGLNDKIKNSFSNRADAIYRWFSSRADLAFGIGGVKK